MSFYSIVKRFHLLNYTDLLKRYHIVTLDEHKIGYVLNDLNFFLTVIKCFSGTIIQMSKLIKLVKNKDHNQID